MPPRVRACRRIVIGSLVGRPAPRRDSPHDPRLLFEMRTMRNLLSRVLVGLSLVAAVPLLVVAAAAADAPLTFEKHIRPILKANCFQCHGEEPELQGNFDARLRRLLVKGGDSGAALAPGEPANSVLLARIEAGEMPPGEKKLATAEVETIRRWIAAGAPTAGPEPESIGAGMLFTSEDRNFWSFQPIADPPVPAVAQAEQVSTPIDAFLLAKLEEQGFGFSPQADRYTLLRRATFDLLGRPPLPEEVAAFTADEAPDAYDRLIERLLASPQYGERWGRHWLDIAGYADSEGYTEADSLRPYAYKYRDYVIRSFNHDLPFDQFVVEQLAGDELVGPPYANLSPEAAEKLTATGFLRMAPDGTTETPPEMAPLARNDVVAQTVQIVSTSLLGLTVGCAQCHHHRYDPISQDDYYRFRALFEPGLNPAKWRIPNNRRVSLFTSAERAAVADVDQRVLEISAERLKKQDELIAAVLEKELAKLPDDVREDVRAALAEPVAKRTAQQKALLKKYPSTNVTAGNLRLFDKTAEAQLLEYTNQINQLRATKPTEDFIRAFTEDPTAVPTTYLFHRGDHEQPQQAIAPDELSILEMCGSSAEVPEKDPSLKTTGRRLAYARHLTSGSHPLLARVWVNRVWLHHFGRGLVATPADFGFLGDRPSHPELLDWLAQRFMQDGWSTKRLHQSIMTSAAYRQGVRRNAEQDVADPDNLLLGGMRPRRLEAEALRDSVLTISGKLNPQRFGPAVPVMADLVGQWVIGIENANAGRPGAVIDMKGEEFRRSIYVQVRRTRPLSVLDTFDAPRMEPNCEVRASSTVATQSLMLLNSQFIVEQAGFMAARVAAEAGDNPADQAGLAWLLAFSRPATAEEQTAAKAFMAEQRQLFEEALQAGGKEKEPAQVARRQALASFCHTLLSSNAFLYVD